MVPETAKTTIRGFFASTASRKLPGPASLRLDTIITSPPRPPVANFPKPSAPGKATGCALQAKTVPNNSMTNNDNHKLKCGKILQDGFDWAVMLIR
jgi:hypothetical protein